MLKKLMLLTAVFAAVIICAAENNLLKLVPRSSICIGYFDVSKIWKHPEVAKQIQKPEVKKAIEDLNGTIGFSFQDINNALIFSDGKNNGGYLIQLKKPVNLDKLFESLKKNPKMQSSHLIGRYVIKRVNGKKVFLFSAFDKFGKIKKLEIVELAPGIILHIVNNSYTSYISEIKGVRPDLRRTIKSVPSKTLAWVAANLPKNPYNIRNGIISFDFVGKALTTQQYVSRINYDNSEQAAQAKLMLPLYFNMGLGILFSADPSLLGTIAKCLKTNVVNNQVILTFTLPKKTFDAILKYLNENQEQLKNLIPTESKQYSNE
jgi:hypothetical protein